MVEFWSRERVVRHVSDKPKLCRATLMLQGPVLTGEQSVILDREDVEGQIRENRKQGLARKHAREPCIRLHGPLVDAA